MEIELITCRSLEEEKQQKILEGSMISKDIYKNPQSGEKGELDIRININK